MGAHGSWVQNWQILLPMLLILSVLKVYADCHLHFAALALVYPAVSVMYLLAVPFLLMLI